MNEAIRARPDMHRPGAAVAPREPDGAVTRAQERAAVREGLLYCLKVFLAVRFALGLVALAGVAVLPNAAAIPEGDRARLGIPGPVSVPGWPAHAITPGWHNVFTSWERFDGLWYLRIADQGYAEGDGSAAFFPLYPLSVRVVGFALGGRPFAASLLVSNLAFLAALGLLYLLGRIDFSETVARRAVLYAAVFPSAFFFLAPYSESLFLALAVLALWAARRGRWPVAALAGALAALTRNIGLVLVVPLVMEAAEQALLARPRRWPARAVTWSLGPAVGAFLYLLYWRASTGDWLAPLHDQANWQREFVNPGGTLLDATREAWRWLGQYAGGYHLLDWLIALPVLAGAAYALVKFRPLYGVYGIAAVLVPLTFVFAGRPLMSFPRFALAAFPAFWAFATWTGRRQWLHEAWVATSAVLLGVLTLLFVNWYYVF